MSSSAHEPGTEVQDPAISEPKALTKANDQEAFDSSSFSNGKQFEVEQAGTKKIEAITSSWSKWGLIVAYISWVTFVYY